VPEESPRRSELITELVSQLRTSNAYSVMVSQAAADRIGINTTDLHSLNILAFSDHELSAGELATTIGLTTASVTGVIDRLEHAGLVRRIRDPLDRRRVVVRLIPQAAQERVAPVFASLLDVWEAELSSYSERELDLILEFQRRTLDIMRGQVALLRKGRLPAAGQLPSSAAMDAHQ
jgi:DNA-binding MarR family transcriptional regulator